MPWSSNVISCGFQSSIWYAFLVLPCLDHFNNTHLLSLKLLRAEYRIDPQTLVAVPTQVLVNFFCLNLSNLAENLDILVMKIAYLSFNLQA
jgi:hypothetical protein